MRRPRMSFEAILCFTLLAGWHGHPHAPGLGKSLADDPKSAPGGQTVGGQTSGGQKPSGQNPAGQNPVTKGPAAAVAPQKPTNNSQVMKHRAQRALARRAEVALDDQFGPGAASLAAVSTGSGSTTNSPGTTAMGGSFGYGGLGGSGMSTGTGGSLGSTGTGSSGGSNTGTGAGGTGSGVKATGTTGNASQSGSSSTEAPDLNAKVLEFAVMNIGKQVGNGQCWDLGAKALAYAGAAPPQGYVFGDAVPLAEMLPGDILQFYDAHFVGFGYWMILGSPHHTAIVQTVNGSTITMLNQNVNGVLRVQKSSINLDDLVSGSVTVYRPIYEIQPPPKTRSPS